ncbi:MAG: hypothetical protein K2H19_05015 [Ruminococcus sp.]|nr:hypothetical protein [Ruminococcus sp.]
MLNIKKFNSLIVSAILLGSFISCDDSEKTASENSISNTVSMGENGVTDIITPAEDSKEYDLGSYRISENGIKLYYDDTYIPTELMLTLEKYFTSFQNKDFESYKSVLAADYIERYNKYLIENYSTDNEEYNLQNSFELRCQYIRNYMIQEILGTYEIPEDDTHTGDFKITRIKAEETTLFEGETLDGLTEKFFQDNNDNFEMDYYNYIKEQSDSLKYFTFYIIAEGEDGEEHRIISEMDIVFAEKNDRYYTFG